MYKSLFLLTLFCAIGLGATDSSASNEIGTSETEEWNATQTDNSKEDEITFGRRIIGGQTAQPNQYSYVVQLRVTYDRGGSFCSGTVLSKTHILTAAHCVYSGRRKARSVLALIPLGSRAIEYVRFSTNEIYVHPSYYGYFNDDIAILKLSNRLMNYDKASPLLPIPGAVSDIFTNTAAVAAGWGKTSDARPVSSNLQYVNVNTITNEHCRSFFRSIITPKVLCTLDVGKGICGGDSGGPLLIVREGTTYVVGVNAFGAGKCQSYKPSGYTYVLPYLNWIRSVL